MSQFSTIPMGTYSIKPQTGFTKGLMDTIAASKAKLEEWAQHEMAKADRLAELNRQKVAEEKAKIEEKRTSLLAVQLELGLTVDSSNQETENSESIATRKQGLEEQQVLLEKEINTLENDFKTREKRVAEISIEEAKQRGRAEEARALKDKVEDAKKTTIDDLTRGIVNYQYLGLDFEKTEIENELRFFFSKLDTADPSKQFSFVLFVNEDDKYEVSNCEPALDAAVLVDVADKLNTSDDMAYLVQKMRRAFQDTL